MIAVLYTQPIVRVASADLPQWYALFALPEVGLGILSRMYFTPQTHDLIGGRRGLGPFFYEVVFKRFCVKFGLLEMMGGKRNGQHRHPSF